MGVTTEVTCLIFPGVSIARRQGGSAAGVRRRDRRGLGLVCHHAERLRPGHLAAPVPDPGDPDAAIARLAAASAGAHHLFLARSVSVLDPSTVAPGRILSSHQLTDVYLLALATADDARLVTFDRSIPLGAVPAATAEYLVVLG